MQCKDEEDDVIKTFLKFEKPALDFRVSPHLHGDDETELPVMGLHVDPFLRGFGLVGVQARWAVEELQTPACLSLNLSGRAHMVIIPLMGLNPQIVLRD